MPGESERRSVPAAAGRMAARDARVAVAASGEVAGGEMWEAHLGLWVVFMRLGGQRGWPGKNGKARLAVWAVCVAATGGIFVCASDIAKMLGMPSLFAVTLSLLVMNAHAKALCMLLQWYPLGDASPPLDDSFDNLSPKAVRLVQWAIYGSAGFIACNALLSLAVIPAIVLVNHPEIAHGNEVMIALCVLSFSVAPFYWLGATCTYFGGCVAMTLRFLELRDKVRNEVEAVAPACMVSLKAIRIMRNVGKHAQVTPVMASPGDGDESAVGDTSSAKTVRSAADTLLVKTLENRHLDDIHRRLDDIRDEYAMLSDTLRRISDVWTGYIAAAEFFIIMAALPVGWMIMNGAVTAKGYDGPVPEIYRSLILLIMLLFFVLLIPAIALAAACITWAAESVPNAISRLAKARSERLSELQSWMMETGACFSVFGVRVSFGTVVQIFYFSVTTATGAIIYYSEL